MISLSYKYVFRLKFVCIGERFNCHNVHRKYVTVANGAIGYQGLFHSTEACNQWILPDRKVKLFSNSTELLIGQFVTDDNSTCTVCQLKSSATSYLIYQLLVSEVGESFPPVM